MCGDAKTKQGWGQAIDFPTGTENVPRPAPEICTGEGQSDTLGKIPERTKELSNLLSKLAESQRIDSENEKWSPLCVSTEKVGI